VKTPNGDNTEWRKNLSKNQEFFSLWNLRKVT